ncbi:hypothetical protein DCAR_0727755 [Daucus carota subsp. sativus]|uniref:Dipeptidylpeptidase IV N-terminal domain-containing protein n=2 Tax=Daucus carota subsp. sativus TaxID=79200 RepID=A0AAF1B8Z6_DAUCS|nr:PREDICTED: uncharacterized protein LOC108196100 [Daucus carota subsp. sativus]WOH08317.1 hypothetical protein DCAR_0727755 [Daucus carota subsp. sativus]
MAKSKQLYLLFQILLVLSLIDLCSSESIIFATLGSRSMYSFDIYSVPLDSKNSAPLSELRLTDGHSLNFNGQFVTSTNIIREQQQQQQQRAIELVYATERGGVSTIYQDIIFNPTPQGLRREALEVSAQRVELLSGDGVSMKDRPSLVGDSLIYVSTHENPGVPRASWAAVYSTQLSTGLTRRLSPYGVADFSPAVSPSGVWTAVASLGDKGWNGEVEELGTDVFVFSTRDGSNRVKVVEHGGWPSWADEFTLYFHRRGDDGWWSIYKAILPKNGELSVDSVLTQRVTPPGVHSFTPAACGNESLVAVATRRSGSDYRHIEIFDLKAKKYRELTRPITPDAHHFSPFCSADSKMVGYHKCRGSSRGMKSEKPLFLENLRSPMPEISLFRVDGSFPSFSPDGNRVAFVDFPGLYVANMDGSGRRQVLSDMAFATAWDPKRKGVVYTSTGPTFETESTEVDIVSVNVDDNDLESSYKKLTHGGANNAFPWPSPDGKWVVFRSGRSGHKNLYIMDAVEGETGGLHRLTEGPWSDTMCNWSPDGEWIAFASDREIVGSGGFELYLIHPNGTGLRKLVQSGSVGRTNHPYFSPDSKKIAFTSDYGAVSAEPISNPHQYQPYGDIYTINVDGSGLKRLTHNSYEDGTPAWGPNYIQPVDVESAYNAAQCAFEDLSWLQIDSPASASHRNRVEDYNGSTKIQCGG